LFTLASDEGVKVFTYNVMIETRIVSSLRRRDVLLVIPVHRNLSIPPPLSPREREHFVFPLAVGQRREVHKVARHGPEVALERGVQLGHDKKRFQRIRGARVTFAFAGVTFIIIAGVQRREPRDWRLPTPRAPQQGSNRGVFLVPTQGTTHLAEPEVVWERVFIKRGVLEGVEKKPDRFRVRVREAMAVEQVEARQGGFLCFIFV
tara:strand:+ start:234 stop:848 length:615 start_codon:yes stop_codon:yes gene_type:complete